jgi:hypothetical protein
VRSRASSADIITCVPTCSAPSMASKECSSWIRDGSAHAVRAFRWLERSCPSNAPWNSPGRHCHFGRKWQQ